MLALLLTAAIVVEDRVPLRAAAADTAPRQEVLFRGDWLEVRGEKNGWVQVWDHRHERPGYVREARVRTYVLDDKAAPALAAVVDFLRESPGQESLGIGYAALYLKSAPPAAVQSPIFDALGTMADRLARRAGAKQAGPQDAALPGQLAVAESYGVHFERFEDGDRTRVCYDGEAFRRVLAMPSSPVERQRAAFALTRPECARPDTPPPQLLAWNEWRREVLSHADPNSIPAWLGNRLRLRRAEVESQLAFAYARKGDPDRARAAADESLRQLALVARADLSPDDDPLREETAIRVGVARPAADTKSLANRPVTLEVVPGQPGETCLHLTDHSTKPPLTLDRCTWAQVWPQSTRVSPQNNTVTISIQPLPGWVELWVFRRLPGAGATPPGWTADVLTPATRDPDLGYVELAGFSPDGGRLLVTRESRTDEGTEKRFQVLRTDTLGIEKEARTSPDPLLAFRKWASPEWRGRTVAIR